MRGLVLGVFRARSRGVLVARDVPRRNMKALDQEE